MAPHVRSLASLDAGDVALAGGKGANLGALIRAGVRVPPGFVITTEAYRHAAGSATTPPSEVPPDLAAEIAVAYDDLGGGPVAVRSSATTEDLAGAAFAGQYDTVLNVLGHQPLLAAVGRCWASLWSPHAVHYRAQVGLDTPEVAMAVVVQRMVQASAAGVMFTADPVTGARDRVVVDAATGLGEGLVSGRVTGDHVVLDTSSGAVLEFTPGRHELVIRARRGGGIEEEPGTGGQVLSAAQLAELVEVGRATERVFGQPQDVEWAWQGDELFIVQARPMTALPDEPVAPSPLRRGQRLFLRILGDMLPSRPYPMDGTLWVPEIYAGVRDFMSGAGICWHGTGSMFVERDGVAVGLDLPEPMITPLSPIRFALSAVRGQPYTRNAFLADPEVRRVLDDVELLRRLDLASLPYAALDAPLRRAVAVGRIVLARRRPFVARSGLRVLRLAAVLGLLGRIQLLIGLLSGADTKTTEANRELERLADRVRASAVLTEAFRDTDPEQLPKVLARSAAGRDFLTDHAGVLAVHGHREGALLLVSQPCWVDEPAATLGAVQALARTPAGRTGSGITQAERELFSHPLLRRGPLEGPVRRWLAAARTLTQFREDTHYYATLGMPLVRQILLAYGRQLAEVGVLNQPEEVFHLRADELELAWPPDPATVARLRGLVERRAAVRAALAGDPWLPAARADSRADESALLVGTGAAAGRVTGAVRVILTPRQFGHLRAGEVLVAPYTNPSWTPLFALAAAVVVDTGSVGSHAAIVAREYGIPAVLGTRTATATLVDGQRVTVDGTRGLVLEADAERSE